MFQSPKTLGGWNKTKRFEKMLDANLFMRYLIDFFDENEDIMMVVNYDNMIEMEDNEAEN